MSIEAMKQAVEAFEAIKKYVTDDGAMPENWDAYHEEEYFALEALRQAIEQAEKQEPVAWMSQVGDVSRSKKHLEEMGFNSVIPLYTAPFNWVGIAVDEIPSLWGNADADLWLFAQAIEDKLRERNT